MSRCSVLALCSLLLGCSAPLAEEPGTLGAAPPESTASAPPADVQGLPELFAEPAPSFTPPAPLPLQVPPAAEEPWPAAEASDTGDAEEGDAEAAPDAEELATLGTWTPPEGPLDDVDGDPDAAAPTFWEFDFAPEAESLRLTRSVTARAEPRADAAPLGTLAQDMRVRWRRAGETADGEVWVELEPRGWVNARALEPNWRAPRLREFPYVPEGAITPGTYAQVVSKRAREYRTLRGAVLRLGGRRLRGSVTVQLVDEVRVRRRRYWRTADRTYVEARHLRLFQPSAFQGLHREALAQQAWPFAWAQSRKRRGAPVEVRDVPAPEGAVVERLAPRTVVPVGLLTGDGAWLELPGRGWVARADLHVARAAPPPLGLGAGERWIDVDLDEQVLVAYEDATPVLATLVTSGSRKHPTPEGIFRIWVKFAETDMTGRMGDDAYRVSRVPWTMFFHQDFALHTAYWHDRFGDAASHGCVNLAPQDARALYHWARPETPEGWSMAYDSPLHAGSYVRVRSAAWPSPLAPMSVAPRVATAAAE